MVNINRFFGLPRWDWLFRGEILKSGLRVRFGGAEASASRVGGAMILAPV
jgi:hypothetical protein